MTSQTKRSITLTETHSLTTIQDLGRTGLGFLGVPSSGALDRGAFLRANRLVGNHPSCAAIETTYFGVSFIAGSECTVAVTGALCRVELNQRASSWGVPLALRPNDVLRIGAAQQGVRAYLAINGGIDGESYFGSSSTDLLSGVGPAPLAPNDVLMLGNSHGHAPAIDLAPYLGPGEQPLLRVHLGPRSEYFNVQEQARFLGQRWQISSSSNRTALRLHGSNPLSYQGPELPSEGIVTGAIQIPHDGQPIVFLADHPVTGGYPVLGTVCDLDLDHCAQLRPGSTVMFQSTPTCSRDLLMRSATHHY
jgi:biotin-dependent carboxylase-like uncharacterized protein